MRVPLTLAICNRAKSHGPLCPPRDGCAEDFFPCQLFKARIQFKYESAFSRLCNPGAPCRDRATCPGGGAALLLCHSASRAAFLLSRVVGRRCFVAGVDSSRLRTPGRRNIACRQSGLLVRHVAPCCAAARRRPARGSGAARATCERHRRPAGGPCICERSSGGFCGPACALGSATLGPALHLAEMNPRRRRV